MRLHQTNIVVRGYPWFPRILPALCLVLFVLPTLSAQQSIRSALLKNRVEQGHLAFLVSRDSTFNDTTGGVYPEKSALTAILLSAVLPGAGQIYTERYWTAPIVIGFTAYFISQWIKADDLYISARDRYRLSVEQNEGGGQGSAQFLYERDFYRDQRDKFAFYLALTYFLNIVDAYVGASLYSFEVDDNLNGVEMKVSIPIR